ncbi:MAG: Lrp/AsnC ligand binding domain-containing protein [Candidatus Aenigmarchaeota archaeon]|nr:Lrp/AsnC ligand binding domain-containing protein [Candidatus Aenigmarchaeota archaeon]
MAIAYVLITTAPGQDKSVYDTLLQMGLSEVNELSGEYSAIVKIEASSHIKVGEIVVNRIRTIKGVIDTKTLTGIKF